MRKSFDRSSYSTNLFISKSTIYGDNWLFRDPATTRNLDNIDQSWDLVAHFEPISESTPTDLLLPLVS